ncbi:MAG: ISAs1 family transposase [Planctomycetota bacterium]|nr:MAG: ISAs1 family transposase [Planctomycetota bacterium]
MLTSSPDLSSLTIRLLTDPSEVAEWNELVSRHHYLSSHRMMGEQLRYVAEVNGYWVACLGWSAASLKLSARDERIGWTVIQQRQRLHLVAQNARFLVLPGFQLPNLASKCLGLNLRRLRADWESTYGHPIWLAETFVESERFDGTCYRACGWQEVGVTKGFRRTREGYRKHGIVKRVFIKDVVRGACRRLASRRHHAEDRPLERIEIASQPIEGTADTPSLFDIIDANVTDPRNRSGRSYRLDCLLGILLTGILAGETTCAGIATWATTLKQHERKRLKCPFKAFIGYVVPTANTLRYVLQDIEPGSLESVTRAWVTACGINTHNTHIAIDGKVLCGSAHDGQPGKAQLNAYHVDQQIPIDQMAIPAKTNEITAARDLLARNDLNGTLVTADAAHTNHETAALIVEKKGSISWPSKGTNLTFTTPPRTHSQPPDSAPTTPASATAMGVPTGEPSRPSS